MTRLTLVAPAKVNLFLTVGGRRSDGYHDVTTVLQALELHDTVTIAPAEELRVSCDTRLGVAAEENIAATAARELAARCRRPPTADIAVSKRVPAGGGLGGGSADAAAVLVGLATAWELASDDPRILDSARAVGADVPFFLHGGTALMSGRGDELVRRLHTPALHFVLVNPGVPVSTTAAYAAFDRAPMPPPADPSDLLRAIDEDDKALVASGLRNDMTEAAVGLVPEVGKALAWLRARTGVLGACIAGSGSTVFAVCEDGDSAKRAAHAALDRGLWAEATRSSTGGARVVEDISEAGGAE